MPIWHLAELTADDCDDVAALARALGGGWDYIAAELEDAGAELRAAAGTWETWELVDMGKEKA